MQSSFVCWVHPANTHPALVVAQQSHHRATGGPQQDVSTPIPPDVLPGSSLPCLKLHFQCLSLLQFLHFFLEKCNLRIFAVLEAREVLLERFLLKFQLRNLRIFDDTFTCSMIDSMTCDTSEEQWNRNEFLEYTDGQRPNKVERVNAARPAKRRRRE